MLGSFGCDEMGIHITEPPSAPGSFLNLAGQHDGKSKASVASLCLSLSSNPISCNFLPRSSFCLHMSPTPTRRLKLSMQTIPSVDPLELPWKVKGYNYPARAWHHLTKFNMLLSNDIAISLLGISRETKTGLSHTDLSL